MVLVLGWMLAACIVTVRSARRLWCHGPVTLFTNSDGFRPISTQSTGNAHFWSRPQYAAILGAARPRPRTTRAAAIAAPTETDAIDADTNTRAR